MSLTYGDLHSAGYSFAALDGAGTTNDITSGKALRVIAISFSSTSAGAELKVYNAATATGSFISVRSSSSKGGTARFPRAGIRFSTGLTATIVTGGHAHITYLLDA